MSPPAGGRRRFPAPGRFNNPLAPEALEAALDRIEAGPAPLFVDVGCGRGELLAMALRRHGGRAVGIDPDEDEIERAAARLAFAGDRVVLHARPVEEVPLAAGCADVAACIGATHAYGPPGEGLARTLDALGRLVRPGGWILVGEGYWRQEPPRAYLAATGMGRSDFQGHPDNVRAGTQRGWEPVLVTESSERAWDRFERAHWDAAEAALERAPEDLAAQEHAAHWRRWRASYERWGRDTLGFGLYLFRCREPAPQGRAGT